MQDAEADVESADFARYFTARRLAVADDPSSMRLAYQLRYEVYCQDCHFLEASNYPDQLESDEFDVSSLHALSFNLQKQLVGYSRLVMPNADGMFPWQGHCSELLPGVVLPPPSHSAEVSRLIVRRDYRRRRGEVLQGITVGLPPPADDDFLERYRRRPQILLSLYRQMYLHCCQTGVRYWYAAMERSLAGALDLMGFPFKRIGQKGEYFGPVAPYLADLRVLEEVLQQNTPELLAWFQKDPGTQHKTGRAPPPAPSR